jgi:hypothetical protein
MAELQYIDVARRFGCNDVAREAQDAVAGKALAVSARNE